MLILKDFYNLSYINKNKSNIDYICNSILISILKFWKKIIYIYIYIYIQFSMGY